MNFSQCDLTTSLLTLSSTLVPLPTLVLPYSSISSITRISTYISPFQCSPIRRNLIPFFLYTWFPSNGWRRTENKERWEDRRVGESMGAAHHPPYCHISCRRVAMETAWQRSKGKILPTILIGLTFFFLFCLSWHVSYF